MLLICVVTLANRLFKLAKYHLSHTYSPLLFRLCVMTGVVNMFMLLLLQTTLLINLPKKGEHLYPVFFNSTINWQCQLSNIAFPCGGLPVTTCILHRTWQVGFFHFHDYIVECNSRHQNYQWIQMKSAQQSIWNEKCRHYEPYVPTSKNILRATWGFCLHLASNFGFLS